MHNTKYTEYLAPQGKIDSWNYHKKMEIPFCLPIKYKEVDEQLHSKGANYSVENIKGGFTLVCIEHKELGIGLDHLISRDLPVLEMVMDMLDSCVWEDRLCAARSLQEEEASQ